MRRYYFVKYGTPVWIRVPGTPFGTMAYPETANRLPGMTGWAPNDVISRVGKSLQEDTPIEDIEQREVNRGLLSRLSKGGLIGGTAGALAGRVIGGEGVTQPFKELMEKGLSKETLKGLGKVPLSAKLLAPAGVGAGLLGALYKWHKTKPQRYDQTQDVLKGLLTEEILQQHALNQASQYYDYPTTQNKSEPFKSRSTMMAGFENMGG